MLLKLRLALVGLLLSAPAAAINFSLPYGDEEFKGVLNTSVTLGAAWRMQERSSALVGKSNIDSSVCGIPYQSCQGDFRDQIYPAARLAEVPGQYTLNADDGNLNYDKHDITQAPFKITQDLSLSFGRFGFFGRALFFYDLVNDNFDEFHPNQINRGNYATVGYSANDPAFTLPYPGNEFGRVYGPGAAVSTPRTDHATIKQIGHDLQTLDSYIYGKLPIPFAEDSELTFKLGRQTVNWGESTLLVINSLNQAQPVNANNFQRVGFTVEEVFTPINQAYVSFDPFTNATMEAFYQLEWKNVEGSAPGSFLSTVDVGTNNAGSQVYSSFGGAAEDPDGLASLQYNPLARITNTTLRVQRQPDLEPKTGGQFGLSLKYFAEDLNNGTELGLYFLNYHSRLPYASFFASAPSCARREGNALGIDAYDPVSFLATCPGIPQVAMSAEAATSSAAALDSARLMLEYPENIQMYGFSFNTTLGDFSLQGEVAYRPNLPLQVDQEDLAFAAYGPTLTRCHDENLSRGALSAVDTSAATGLLNGLLTSLGVPVGVPNVLPVGTGCAGTTAGIDTNNTRPDGASATYAPSDFLLADGTNPYPDTFDLAVGHLPGSARAFPNFIIPYRGGTVGENAPTDFTQALDRNNPGYIRGYERFDVYQFNLGATRVYGATENPFAADQIIMLFEAGATWVPGLPALDQLQIEAPGTFLAASAGADGSGGFYDDSTRQQACSTNPTCSYGADGLRFNPHQENLHQYVTKFSWGYRVVGLIKYESVLPGISLQPTIILAHDVDGISPGPGENFQRGRKSIATVLETRYKSSLTFNVGYTWFTGGGDYNLLRDRDYAQAFARYLF